MDGEMTHWRPPSSLISYCVLSKGRHWSDLIKASTPDSVPAQG